MFDPHIDVNKNRKLLEKHFIICGRWLLVDDDILVPTEDNVQAALSK
jgi:hypothetical protein